jgi:annexin D
VYKEKLEDAIVSDTSGNYRKLLVAILNGGRAETNQVDMNLVRSDADELMKAGIKK